MQYDDGEGVIPCFKCGKCKVEVPSYSFNHFIDTGQGPYRIDLKQKESIMTIIDVRDYKTHDELAVVEIPDEATDYYIEEYDGAESVLYVLDGKIHFLQRIKFQDGCYG